MDAPDLEVDYLIIGAGACGMAFADVIHSESSASMAIADRHAQPGGHWNDAYSFVRLHQPSAFYGVNSRQLGGQRRDDIGTNDGLFELASGHEVLSYFEAVMHEQFMPSGRVHYFPMSDCDDDGVITSLLTGVSTRVRARRTVDARYLGSSVPSVHTPSFAADEGAQLVPINDLAKVTHPYKCYVVIGAGKTGVDACLWLLAEGVDPASITWVRPRDSWFLRRARIQPESNLLGTLADQLEAAASATSVDNLVERLEASRVITRIDPACWPTMFRGATMSDGEVEVLQRITRVIRLGYVTHIEPELLHLDEGTVEVSDGSLFVDCSAEGIRNRPPVPIFKDGRVTLQYAVNAGQPTYSAALIARVELALDDDEDRNDACPPIAVTGHLRDFAVNLLTVLVADDRRNQVEELKAWMDGARLNPAMWALADADRTDEAAMSAIGRILTAQPPAIENLRRIVANLA